MKLLFTGDVNFRGIENLDYGKSSKILNDVIPYIKSVDFVIPNLECPLGNEEDYMPIKKAGPNLICSKNHISFLKAMNTYAVTLANNHIGDYGERALNNTLKLLDENNIKYAGAGNNISEAYSAIRISKEGITISLLSVCENEFGVAEENKAGSAGYNPRLLMNKIQTEKNVSDFIIVVFHGGNEYNPLPSPDTVERYRFICDMGADAVIAGHTHCPQGYETYNGKPIIYSMGNFLFRNTEKTDNKDSWYYGYFTILDINMSKISFDIVPYKFDISGTKITVFDGKDKVEMNRYIDNLSEIIQNPSELKQYFKGWSLNHIWIPQLPENIYNLTNYNASGNYDLLKCEAHLSQAKQIFEILFNDEIDNTKTWQKKISELQKMPV